MKQDLYTSTWISAENQSAEINLRANREEVFLIVLLKTVFENLNTVKGYDYTNSNVFVLVYGKNYRRGLISFGQYTMEHGLLTQFFAFLQTHFRQTDSLSGKATPPFF